MMKDMGHLEHNKLLMKRSCHPLLGIPWTCKCVPPSTHLLMVFPPLGMPFLYLDLSKVSRFQMSPPSGSLPRLTTQRFGRVGTFSPAVAVSILGSSLSWALMEDLNLPQPSRTNSPALNCQTPDRHPASTRYSWGLLHPSHTGPV